MNRHPKDPASSAPTATRGIVYMLAAVALLSTSDAATKSLAPHYSVVQIVFVRAFLGVLPAALLAFLENGKQGLIPRLPHLHVLRTGLMLAAWGLFILAIRVLPLADTYTIVFGAPLFMALFGRILLGERVTPQRWTAVCIGFVGVLIVLHPSGAGLGPPVLLALAAALAWAFATIVSRKLGQNERSSTVLFTYMLLSLVATAPFVVGQWTPIATDHTSTFILMGVIGTVAHWLLAQAFRYSEISLLAPFEYTGLVWAIGLGFWLWGDVPTRVMLTGASLIIGSGIYMIQHESRTMKKQADELSASSEEVGQEVA